LSAKDPIARRQTAKELVKAWRRGARSVLRESLKSAKDAIARRQTAKELAESLAARGAFRFARVP